MTSLSRVQMRVKLTNVSSRNRSSIEFVHAFQEMHEQIRLSCQRDVLIYIKQLTPSLNVQTDSIRAKVFV